MKKLLFVVAFVAASFISAVAQITITETITHVSCNGRSDACIDLTVTGGTAPYTYLWNNASTAMPLCSLSAGTYDVTVIDANSASATGSFTVTQPTQILVSETHTDVSCNGSCDGTITVNATGGIANYTYSIDNGLNYSFSANQIFGLCANVYQVKVRDSIGCESAALLVTITEPTLINVTEIHTDVTCNGSCDGTIDLIVAGGVGVYTYVWSNGSTTLVQQGLCAGIYSATITDANNCSTLITVTINESAPIIVSGSVTDATCNGGCDGAIIMIPNGGTAPYQYVWSNGMTTQNVTGACPGTYSVTVVDGNGCTGVQQFTVLSSGSGNITIVGVVTPSICGQQTGAIDITVTGGTPGYTYTWSNAMNTEDATGLSSGVYSVTVTDTNGCNAVETFAVNDTGSVTLSLVATDILCDSVGTITATFSGGTVPYLINWGDGSTISVVGVSPQIHEYFSAGTYTIMLGDSNSCITSASATINDLGIVISLIETIQPTGCTLANGKLKIIASGGTPPFTYLWSNGATTDSIINVAAGTYTVTVTDTTGCVASQTFTLTAITQGFTAVTSSTSVNCSNGSQGSATVTANGGFPPYTYLWSNGATTQTISGLAVGVYMVTVTDSSGCAIVRTAYVNYSGQSFYVYLTSVAPNCGNNGSVTATPSNGTAPYTYLWSNGATTQNISGLAAGTYTVTVTDSTGCTRVVSRTLTSTCYNVITGNVFNDLNGNCIKDVGETTLTNSYVMVTNGSQTNYSSINANGEYNFYVGSGTFNVSFYNYYYYQCTNIVVCGTSTVTFPGLGDTTVRNIGIQNLSQFDLSLFVNWTGANPGFQKGYGLHYFNLSPVAFNGTATITFQYDPQLVYQNSSPSHATHDAINHTLTWNVNGLPANSNGYISCAFMVPVNTPINYVVNSDFDIAPSAGDCNVSNNATHASQVVTGSFDPNEKEVLPAGNILEEDSVLTYTIHFQNTGNDTTHFVVLKDTLSEYLEAASVQNIASSHSYSDFTVSGEGILTWTFNPLYLPDSNTNEPASKGFVMFRVKKKANLPINTIISNTASIYFDYNPPIVTNTVENTLTEPVGIWNREADNLVSVYPNPASNELRIQSYEFGISSVKIFDVAGKEIGSHQCASNSVVVLNVSDVSTGLYFIHTQLSNGETVVKKIVKE